MKRHKKLAIKRIIRHESGVTLVELLVAIVLISIIVTTFLSFFIQAARTNNMTNHVTEATLIAQEEMELLTHHAKNDDLLEYLAETEPTIKETFKIERLSKEKGSLLQVIVTVKENNEGGKVLAQMENWLPIQSEE